jgi:hypothetical protein
LKNYVLIKNGVIYQTGLSEGTDEVLVMFAGVESTTCTLEIYKGNEYMESLDCVVSGGTALVVLPSGIYTGSRIHFRLNDGGTLGEFYHIVADPATGLILTVENFVVLGAKRNTPVVNDLTARYVYLNLFTHGFLDDFTNDQIGGGVLG